MIQFLHPLFDFSFVGSLHIKVCIFLAHITIFDGSMILHRLIYFWYNEQMFTMAHFLIAWDISTTHLKRNEEIPNYLLKIDFLS
jgi:hypothetical protein